MSEHLTRHQIEAYERRQLSAADLLSVSDHLSTCGQCRELAETAMGSDLSFFAVRSQVLDTEAGVVPPDARAHLTTESVAEYVDGALKGQELQGIEDHLTNCGHCSLMVDDLRIFRDQVAPTLDHEYQPAHDQAKAEGWWHGLAGFLPTLLPRSSAFALGSAFVVILLAFTAWLIWRDIEKKETTTQLAAAGPSPAASPEAVTGASPIPSPTASAEQAVLVAELEDAGGRVTLDNAGKLSGVDHLPPTYQRLVRDALGSQQVQKSRLLAGLNRPASSLMAGGAEGDKLSVIKPAGVMIESNRPTFSWSRLKGASGYVVEVYDEGFNLVATSPHLNANSWTAPPLKRGGIYSWQVTAIKDGQQIKSPQPPAPQAKFRVLDSSTVNELRHARRSYGSSHLMLGLLYTRAGLLDQAVKEFRALEKANPNSSLVRGLLGQVRDLRR